MLTKERLAELAEGLARIFPGIPSYQEREGLRAQDKIIRSQLGARIFEEAARIRQLMADFTNEGILAPLARLDSICRKLERLSDTIRFARYGYSSLFASASVDEKRLAELYDYDLSLNRDIEELSEAVSTLSELSAAADERQEGPFEDIRQVVDRLEGRIRTREPLFTGS